MSCFLEVDEESCERDVKAELQQVSATMCA